MLLYLFKQVNILYIYYTVLHCSSNLIMSPWHLRLGSRTLKTSFNVHLLAGVVLPVCTPSHPYCIVILQPFNGHFIPKNEYDFYLFLSLKTLLDSVFLFLGKFPLFFYQQAHQILLYGTSPEIRGDTIISLHCDFYGDICS